MGIAYSPRLYLRHLGETNDIDFQIKLLGALSVGDVRTGTIPSLLPSQKHYLKVYSVGESGDVSKQILGEPTDISVCSVPSVARVSG
ncbi:MAG: hypothetical protein V1736_13970 [Pseudomonadota bacterium]